MTKHVFVLAAAALVAAPALAGTTVDFVRDGVRYVADVSQQNGEQLIQGREVQSGRTFSLHVRNGFVSGNYDGENVAYRAPKSALVRTASN
ncbi:hypothetical protein [Sphingomonas nostoxanthinifaciens]|uniref:hypothetical protein n=1 Tax=Sphingomonas nostoxanthinifaciens TaxID=2872652 RepID=UPI001CC1C9C9|nr:hypothetical protein [Sphingomonas nostoxanthinifaciens]UAK24713.1 hypothetical protein K8P63_00350 [Sphingomonas nostoxanthinifaciens]